MNAAGAGRTSPEGAAGERELLEQWLDYHRDTLLMKCAGLDDARLRLRSCPPSSLSLLGLVRHLVEVERAWFLRGVAGRSREEAPPLYYDDANPDGDLDDVDTADVAEAFMTYRRTVDEARAVAAGAGLDDRLPPRPSDPREPSVRWVYLHMIEEYARHNGHADLLRERIDGVIGE